MAVLDGVKRDVITTSAFAVTNFVEDYTLDANANNDLNTADVLATLIRDLARKGIINGDVTA